MVKNPSANAGDKRLGFNPWVGKIPWSRKWQPPLVFLPGKFHGQRSLAGYNHGGHTELDTTEHTHTSRHCCNHRGLSGERNPNSLFPWHLRAHQFDLSSPSLLPIRIMALVQVSFFMPESLQIHPHWSPCSMFPPSAPVARGIFLTCKSWLVIPCFKTPSAVHRL